MHARSGAMPDPQSSDHSDHGALTTATIFDDAVYCSEALRLPANQTEDQMDAELALLATESGIPDPYHLLCVPHDVSRALSTVTLDSDHRSSMSIHSQETQSTSFTSAHSRTSKDHTHNSERLPAMRTPPKAARMSPTAECQDPLSGVSTSGIQQRSYSTLSVSQTVLSDFLFSAPVTRKKRASGLFSMFRRNSSSCTSQSHQAPHNEARGPKLDCGHSLSPSAIRTHIQEASQGGKQAAPSCCGNPLPRKVLEVVLTKNEAELLANRAIPSPESETLRDPPYNEKDMSAVDVNHPLNATLSSATSTSLPTAPCRRRHEAISIDSAIANEAFKTFRAEEKEQFEQVSNFECNQRKALLVHHTTSLERLAAQHEASRNEKMKQHVRDLEQLEEVQVMAEHDLRNAHNSETQNVATALKHMEAYCLGSGISHPDHHHIVTEEDFKKLDRQRTTQRNLPRKHENAINVLRAKQERGTKNKTKKQIEELNLLDASYETQRAAEVSKHRKDMERLEGMIEERRKRLMRRWDLKFEMWRRDWERQHGTPVTGRLEHENWPVIGPMTSIPESSLLAPYVQAAA